MGLVTSFHDVPDEALGVYHARAWVGRIREDFERFRTDLGLTAAAGRGLVSYVP